MSLPIADQMLKSLISKEKCRGCSEIHYELLENVMIPFCKKRWYGGDCIRTDGDKK